MNTVLPSTRPYLIRALHEWCSVNGLTPYILVLVDSSVRVPYQHIVGGEIVLNVSTDATGSLVLGDEFIEFEARFGGVAQQVVVPVARVAAIYSRENGQGMTFPVDTTLNEGGLKSEEVALTGNSGEAESDAVGYDAPKSDESGSSPRRMKPTLKRIK
jgi:stringent starvation protein B